MKVLITAGSTRGGTAGIAEALRQALGQLGVEAQVEPPGDQVNVAGFDAVVVGGALYANRWHKDARRFVRHHAAALRGRPVWFFSSGPLDDRATRVAIPPTRQVFELMRRVNARGHATFGGRLSPDAQGFIARMMAKKKAGDWRDARQIHRWAKTIADALHGEEQHAFGFDGAVYELELGSPREMTPAAPRG